MFGYNEVIRIMDNCPSHKNKATYSVLNKSNFQINFIPTYSPDLALVELSFAFILKKYILLWRSLKVNLNTKQLKNELLKVLKMLTTKLVKGFYSKFYEILKEYFKFFSYKDFKISLFLSFLCFSPIILGKSLFNFGFVSS